MRVVADTNVLISGALWPGPSHRIIELAEAGEVTLCVTEPILEERVPFDANDEMFVACAVSAGSAFIMSGDTHLLRLKQYGTIRIVKPAEFLRLIET